MPGPKTFRGLSRLEKRRNLRARNSQNDRITIALCVIDWKLKCGNRISDVVMNGDREQRLDHLSNISFRFIEGEGLLINLDLEGVAVSTGSACSSGTLEPSPVIRALGVNDELARGSIRFSFGKDNTEEDVDYTVEVLSQAVERLRAFSPLTLVSQ